MPAAITHRRLLLAVAAGAYAAVFVTFVAVGSPGLGIGHFFYIPVALVALVTGPLGGCAAGVAAAALYALGVVASPDAAPEVLTLAAGIRMVTYSTTGALIGWFASDHRRLVHELRILAERDALTGLPNTRAFEAAIQKRLDTGRPFALLIGDITPLAAHDSDAVGTGDALLRLTELLGGALGPEDELARVGGQEFAVLTSAQSSAAASHLCGRLESMLAAHGLAITFGWAVHPQEGRNALSLYRAADERLYARRLVGGHLRGVPAVQSAS